MDAITHLKPVINELRQPSEISKDKVTILILNRAANLTARISRSQLLPFLLPSLRLSKIYFQFILPIFYRTIHTGQKNSPQSVNKCKWKVKVSEAKQAKKVKPVGAAKHKLPHAASHGGEIVNKNTCSPTPDKPFLSHINHAPYLTMIHTLQQKRYTCIYDGKRTRINIVQRLYLLYTRTLLFLLRVLIEIIISKKSNTIYAETA